MPTLIVEAFFMRYSFLYSCPLVLFGNYAKRDFLAQNKPKKCKFL